MDYDQLLFWSLSASMNVKRVRAKVNWKGSVVLSRGSVGGFLYHLSKHLIDLSSGDLLKIVWHL